MEQSVILSVNDNPDYLYYTPICAWAWRQMGWNPVIFYVGEHNELVEFTFDIARMWTSDQIEVDIPEGYRSDTITQVCRLYAHYYCTGYLLLGDIDMIPCKNIWTRDFNNINVFGWDLTGRTQIPMCYVGMTSENWKMVMQPKYGLLQDDMEADLFMYPQAKDKRFDKYWYTDQAILTAKLRAHGLENGVMFHDRGTHLGLAKDRVDRALWKICEDPIDSHLMRNAYKNETAYNMNMNLYQQIFGTDSDWIKEYTDDYRSRVNG